MGRVGSTPEWPTSYPTSWRVLLMISAVHRHTMDFHQFSSKCSAKSTHRISMTEVSLTPLAKLEDRKLSAVVADGLGLLCSANLNSL